MNADRLPNPKWVGVILAVLVIALMAGFFTRASNVQGAFATFTPHGAITVSR